MRAIVATLVVTAAVITKTMKDLNATTQALRGDVNAKDHGAVAKDAAKLKELFGTVEAFWKEKGVEDAVNFANTGLQAATDLETAAKAKNDDDIAKASRAVGGTCMGCHTAHREKVGEGYEIT